ncbi:MAG: type IV pilus modification protein PilV [Methylobacillus sp.]|jgi:type IV pilus assembly protein PilV|nr:type IV pilus modification protein PilV [Methylobacillus sp.]
MKPAIQFSANRRRVHGLTLIEVLVTIAIVAFGLLGLAGLLAKSTVMAGTLYMRSTVTERIYSFADRMRLNMKGVNAGDYNNLTAPPDPAPDCRGLPSPCNIALMDYIQWSQELKQSLPGGKGTIIKTASTSPDVYTITVTWINPRLPEGQQDQQYKLDTKP